MSRPIASFALAVLSIVFVSATASQTSATSSTEEIDRDAWSAFVATVAADDIVGMGQVYLTEAVLVTPKGTQPIKAALERWGRDMVANRAKGTKATVAFRFSHRQDDSATAFESGIFNYTVIATSGERTPTFYPFEELFVKTDGKWRVLMERQFEPVTQAEWDRLPE